MWKTVKDYNPKEYLEDEGRKDLRPGVAAFVARTFLQTSTPSKSKPGIIQSKTAICGASGHCKTSLAARLSPTAAT